MHATVELTLDVTAAAGLGEPAQIAATVHLPDPAALASPPVVCFGFPGGGYGRRYWSFDQPGHPQGQAGWHAARGWVFVGCDHLGVGDSTVPDPDELTFETVTSANRAAVEAVIGRLEAGTLAEGFPAVTGATSLALGQSMGGCFTIVLQGQHHPFAGVGILGYSAIHTVVPSAPGAPPTPMPWIVRSSSMAAPVIVNAAVLARASATEAAVISDQESLIAAARDGQHPWTWAFHHEDEEAALVAEDMAGMVGGPLPPWRSATTPACAGLMVAPGAVAAEAAAIDVPVLVACGERDVVPDVRMEAKAYQSSPDITIAVFERMAHMHNFSPTREQLWARTHGWGSTVAMQEHS